MTPAGLAARDTVKVVGDIGRLTELLGHLGDPDPDFAIVTP
ncbi:Alkyl sulfatase C-terminal [Streptomyces atratus]|uniref:Alkyl sulfatase C-terminal n=2 Tax=Streptomyces atratus TaxID=1893 RepID=A0A1K2EQZ6_STRAR|nr:Alkyl sulfatase C-terminal [Streptomyces atratus]